MVFTPEAHLRDLCSPPRLYADAYTLREKQAWDLGGHEAVRYLWFDFLGDSHAIIFMVDGADKERLDEAHWELTELLSDVSTAPTN